MSVISSFQRSARALIAVRGAVAALLFWLGCAPSLAAVTVDRSTTSDQMRFLIVKGEFEFSDDARMLLDNASEFKPVFVTFQSGGGNVEAAMRFGRMVRTLGLATIQPRSEECSSACSLVFMGGTIRSAESGAIGVHKSSFAPSVFGGAAHEAVSSVQQATADIISYMIEMGVDPALLQLSLSVDSDDMRYLTGAEMKKFRVTTLEGPPASADVPASPPAAVTAPGSAEPPPAAYAAPAVAPAEKVGKSLATIEAEARRPNRIAIYNGLDFLGRDLGSASVSDATSCAIQCLSDTTCKAFTFNMKTAMGRGPNCFLKESQGQLDGNSAAVSGRLLARMEADATTFTFGAIDPNTNLYRNVDLPGHDLSRRPHPDAHSQLDCRMACVNEASCAAFTYLPKKKECWLKGAIGQPRALAGAVTGAKSPMTYAPTHVTLD